MGKRGGSAHLGNAVGQARLEGDIGRSTASLLPGLPSGPLPHLSLNDPACLASRWQCRVEKRAFLLDVTDLRVQRTF